MKKICMILLTGICLIGSFSSCFAEKDIWDKETEAKMRKVDVIMREIRNLPMTIDGDLCNHDDALYKEHMTLLAQKIIDANTLLKDVKLVYPMNLWSIYNTISSNPICGIGRKALGIFDGQDVSRYTNEERMGINENSNLCYCWNLVTGREELTGFYKDGACRCTFGINNLDPHTGRWDN